MLWSSPSAFDDIELEGFEECSTNPALTHIPVVFKKNKPKGLNQSDQECLIIVEAKLCRALALQDWSLTCDAGYQSNAPPADADICSVGFMLLCNFPEDFSNQQL